jgi:hypothetical protein
VFHHANHGEAIDAEFVLHGFPEKFFYRMPPVSMHTFSSTFMPDYAALLLSDKVILDTATFLALQANTRPAYALVADTMSALTSEGFSNVRRIC